MKIDKLTIIRLIILPLVIIGPFKLMHGKLPTCNLVDGVSFCVQNETRPHALVQIGIYIAALALVYAANKMWNRQFKKIKDIKAKREFLRADLILSLLVALGTVRAYFDIWYNHSEHSLAFGAVDHGVVSSYRPFFGVGFGTFPMYVLVIGFLLPVILNSYRLFSKKFAVGFNKDKLFQ